MRILLTRISFLFSFSLAFSVSSFSSDLSPQMAQNTLNQFKTLYGAAPLHLNKTLFDVPFYRATPEFLAKYGSSVGIYFRKAVYLHQEQFLTTGINVDSPSVSNVVTHEGWHAYYDQILSRADRQKIENIWTSYYRRAGVSTETAICFGDEAIGNYLGNLMFVYGYTANYLKKKKTITPGVLKIYTSNYEAADLNGYCSGNETAPYVISEAEKEFARSVAGIFPKPAELEATLRARLSIP